MKTQQNNNTSKTTKNENTNKQTNKQTNNTKTTPKNNKSINSKIQQIRQRQPKEQNHLLQATMTKTL